MKKIELVYSKLEGLSDTAAVERARQHIEETLRETEDKMFYFGNVIYLNEWRISVRSFPALNVSIDVYGQIIPIDTHGRLPSWPDELSVWDSQLDLLL